MVVRYIEFEEIVKAVESLCIAAAYELPIDVLAALEKAAQRESNPAVVRQAHHPSEVEGLQKY